MKENRRRGWSRESIVTVALSSAALIISIIHLIYGMIASRLNDDLRVTELIDTAHEKMWGATGYSNTSNIKMLNDAEKDIGKACLIKPKDARVIQHQGYLHELRGRKDLAAIKYRESIVADPKRPSAYNDLSIVSREKEAIQVLQKSITINGVNSFTSYDYLGDIYFDAEDYKNAEIYYRKAIEINPNFSSAYLKLGRLHEKSNDFVMAERNYKQAVSCDSENIDAMIDLGRMLVLKLNKEEEGMLWIKTAKKNAPTNPAPDYTLAKIYLERNNMAKALEYARLATELTPKTMSDSNSLFSIINTLDLLKKRASETE